MMLKIYPDPIFKQTAEPIENFDQEIEKMERLFFSELKAYNALGLGANMLGLLKRAIIVSDGVGEPIFMVNPIMEKISDEMEKGDEASLSIPGIKLNISRYKNIKVTYQNSKGEHFRLECTGLLARVVQHELDYLNGITIFDHLPQAKKMMMLERYLKIIKSQQRRGS